MAGVITGRDAKALVDGAVAELSSDPRKPKRIVAAMSGGVDSSVAAFLLKEAGIDVVGVTLRLRSCSDEKDEVRKACCGAEDSIHARLSAGRMGIPHYFLDYQDDFRRIVLERAWSEYEKGRTPNPCVLCNRWLKFGRLMDYAGEIGADGMATGHYARVLASDRGEAGLYRGLDPVKDQSYFLFDLRRENLRRCWFPLGSLKKSDVREIARFAGLANAERRESQDACFGVKGESFPETLRRVLGAEVRPGTFVDEQGKILGRHDGVYAYTLGQRRGLGIALGSRGYVAGIRPETAEVVVSTDERLLLADFLEADEVNWLAPEFAAFPFTGEAQVRYGHRPEAAEIVPLPDGGIEVRFRKPVRAVTPGQAAVVYAGDRLICGGWIRRPAVQR